MRVWYAETPTQLAAINANWPILNPMQRGMILQQWAAELPAMLWMLDPVLAEAQNLELQEHVRANIAASRQQAAPTYNSSQAAMNQIETRATQATRLASFNVNMTANTINQMRAMNNH
jgi:pyridoxal/pyridoxine/pyridoxamine kinase